MTLSTDQHYLLNQQYRDASNLAARATLHQRFGTNPTPWMHWVFHQLSKGLPARAQLLEVGGGPGWLWRENLERVPEGWHITFSDFSPGMLAEAQAHLDDPRFHFQEADVQALPFDDGRFNAVVANHMLYHVPDLQRGLGEIRRVLAHGGHLVAATNGRNHLRELDMWVARGLGISLEEIQSNLFRLGFTLENGHEQLSRHFREVRYEAYPDSLEVTEAEPMVAYILSGGRAAALSDDQINRIRGEIAAEIAREGAIHITKETGLFLAR